jgi:hypothetical protein
VVVPDRGITDVCVWYVLNSARVTVAAPPTASITSLIVSGVITDIGKMSVQTVDVRNDALLRFTFSAPDPVVLSVSPLDRRAPLPSFKTEFTVDGAVHFFVTDAVAPPASEGEQAPTAAAPTYPGRHMGGAEWELIESMLFTGACIIGIAICWCCLGACCYRMAKRRNAQRQRQAIDENELDAIPPVLPGQYQPIAQPDGYAQPPYAVHPHAQYPAPQPQYPGQQLQFQPQGQPQFQPQGQPQFQPQGGRGPGIVYGH